MRWVVRLGGRRRRRGVCRSALRGGGGGEGCEQTRGAIRVDARAPSAARRRPLRLPSLPPSHRDPKNTPLRRPLLIKNTNTPLANSHTPTPTNPYSPQMRAAGASTLPGRAPTGAARRAKAPCPSPSSSSTSCARTPSTTPSLLIARAGSTYGTNFRVTTFGESHGGGVGCVVDGVPPRLPLTTAELQTELDRRRPGQSIITTPRKEEDTCEILSGVGDGVTLGTPIAVLVRNKDQRSQDYSEMSVAYRPSHADATYDFKYGIRAVAGGGRSSARETIGRVAAGAIAKKLLSVVAGTEVLAYVSRVREIGCEVDEATFTMEDVESNIVRCPDQGAAQKMIDGERRERRERGGGGGLCVCLCLFPFLFVGLPPPIPPCTLHALSSSVQH
jgi:chorismate synthase